VYIAFWLGNLKERENFEDLGLDGRIIIKWVFKKWHGAWIGLILLRIGTIVGGIL